MILCSLYGIVRSNDFFIPGTHLCNKFVCLFLGNGLAMMSYAVEFINDQYKRGMIEFDLGRG